MSKGPDYPSAETDWPIIWEIRIVSRPKARTTVELKMHVTAGKLDDVIHRGATYRTAEYIWEPMGVVGVAAVVCSQLKRQIELDNALKK